MARSAPVVDIYNTSVYRSDRSRSESWKGGEAFSLNKPDVLEQQSHLSSNRGVDCHELREGGGHQQHQWADDDMFPPSSSMYIIHHNE